MSFSIPVKYYNSFWAKKVSSSATDPDVGSWPGLPWDPTGYPPWPFDGGSFNEDFGLLDRMWYIEESRIRGGYNNTSVDLGARAYLFDKDRFQHNRYNYLIYSGIYNSKSNFNETNVFSIAEPIMRAVPPNQGSIQKLYAEDTNLIIFQENKVSRALINKNTVYSGDQGAVDNNRVIGQIIAYVGEYGISRNPESFAKYGYRKYFVDRNKGVVLRLSRDGITEISSYGMMDYFRDNLATLPGWEFYYTKAANGTNLISIVSAVDGDSFTITLTGTTNFCDITPGTIFQIDDPSNPGTPITITDINSGEPVTVTHVNPLNGQITLSVVTQYGMTPNFSTSWVGMYAQNWANSRIVGGWDIHTKNYTVSLQNKPPYIIKQEAEMPIDPVPYTTRLKEGGNFDTLNFDESVLGWVSFYTYPPMWIDSLRNKYFTMYTGNDGELLWKHYDDLTPNSRGLFYGIREKSNITFVLNNAPYISKNFQTISYEGSSGWEVDSLLSDFEGQSTLNAGVSWNEYQDTTSGTPPGVSVASHLQGKYELLTPTNSGLAAITPPYAYAGFARKENRYVAKLNNTSSVRPGEVYFDDPLNPGTYLNPSSGVKGFFATVKMSTDNITDVGGMKELFSVASKYVVSAM